MLGKLAEKLKKGNECLSHYHHALEWMDEFASYPAKIPSKTNSGTFCHETLEVFYRITAFVTKKYEAGEDVLDLKNDILGLLQTPVFTRDGDEKVDATQFSFATNADIVQQCIRNYELILKRYPQHYKSYYRLAKVAFLEIAIDITFLVESGAFHPRISTDLALFQNISPNAAVLLCSVPRKLKILCC
jgi:hypothetical protein